MILADDRAAASDRRLPKIVGPERSVPRIGKWSRLIVAARWRDFAAMARS